MLNTGITGNLGKEGGLQDFAYGPLSALRTGGGVIVVALSRNLKVPWGTSKGGGK